METYKILRVMNNNVILVQKEPQGNQMVLIGNGLGFGKKPGAVVSSAHLKIEKSFLSYDTRWKCEYLNLLEQMDDNVIGLCSELILLAEKRMGKLNENLLIVLTDHIQFAIERIKRGLRIENPFLYEIQSLYPEEYAIGLIAKKKLKEQTGVEINEDEVAFIALHLNAAKQNIKVSDSLNKTRVVKLMLTTLEENIGVKFHRDLTYIRLISHFRASLDRAEKNIAVENPLLPAVRTNFKKSFALAQKIGELVRRECGFSLPEGELGYLAIHIDRICRIIQQKK